MSHGEKGNLGNNTRFSGLFHIYPSQYTTRMRLANSIRSFIFPPHCTGCGAPGTWICGNCRNLLLVRAPPECFICRKISNGYRTHDTCRAQTAIARTVICWRYNDLAKNLMKHLKYRVHYDISRQLASLAKDVLQPRIPDDAVLVPVPTTPARMRERGFNQSARIAREISRQCATARNPLPVHDILHRAPSSESQASKKRDQRHSLSKDEFSIERERSRHLLRKPVILIDDVCTTGTTLQRCGEVLYDAGFRDISAIALFRGKPKYSQETQRDEKVTGR
jgi:competence protein ComFC